MQPLEEIRLLPIKKLKLITKNKKKKQIKYNNVGWDAKKYKKNIDKKFQNSNELKLKKLK